MFRYNTNNCVKVKFILLFIILKIERVCVSIYFINCTWCSIT